MNDDIFLGLMIGFDIGFLICLYVVGRLLDLEEESKPQENK